ncbi:MAG: hypothetical protein V9E82_06125 [Candidatus Nanopelagicales bacterium]
MVDLTRDKDGHGRLLDLVPGRSGTVYADWLKARGDTFRTQVRVTTLDPFHGYKTRSMTSSRTRPPCWTRSMS